MEFMPDEKTLLESDTKELVLTTHRVRYQAKQWGGARLTSIMLEELCSCEVRHSSNPTLLILAGLAVIAGIASQSDYGQIGFLVGLVLIMAYFLTRRAVISLASGGATINLLTRGMSFESVAKFIGEVEAAKNQRVLLLSGR